MSKGLLGLIFDFDGTLVNSMGDFGQVAADVIASHFDCDREWALKRYRETSGLPFSFQLESLFPQDKKNQNAVCEFEETKRQKYAQCDFFPEVFDVLVALKRGGHALAISSNNDHKLLHEKLGSKREVFDIVLGYHPGFLKGPDHFRWVGHALRLDFHQMLFVGDSIHDGLMAQKQGVAFVARLGTFLETCFQKAGLDVPMIRNLTELQNILFKRRNLA